MTVETKVATPLAMFTAACEALEVPVGSRRLDAFLRLPEWQQEAIFIEIAAEADAQAQEGPKP